MAKDKGKAAVAKTNNVLERLEVKYVPVGDLRPNDYNPNRQSDHDFELLLRSMREDGFTQPIVAQGDGIIVDGEHRWRAGQTLGMTEVPVVFVDMTVEQMKIATLRHNRARGSEDVELASSVLRDLAALGALDYAQDSLMIDDTELQRLIEDIGAPEALAGEQFSESWEPTENEGGQDSNEIDQATSSGTTDAVVTEVAGGGTQTTGASAAAIEAKRDQERRLATAKDQQERDTIAKEAKSFTRLMLMFHGDESKLVDEVLGTEAPANRLVALCQAYKDENPDEFADAAADKGE